MAIDFDAIRRKLNSLQGKNSMRNSFWKPQDGEESVIRIIPWPDNDGQPFKERSFYYNIGSNPGLLTPSQFNDPDPVQELINKLREDSTKESYDLAKQLYPKTRAFWPIIVRGEEDKGVRLWNVGKLLFESILSTMMDEDYGDITDPETGHDLKVVAIKKPGERWAKVTVSPRPKKSKLLTGPDAAKTIETWLSNIPDLNEIYTAKSYDELNKIINDWLNEGVENEDEGTTRSSASTSSKSETSANTSKAFADVDDAFSDLLKDEA